MDLIGKVFSVESTFKKIILKLFLLFHKKIYDYFIILFHGRNIFYNKSFLLLLGEKRERGESEREREKGLKNCYEIFNNPMMIRGISLAF